CRASAQREITIIGGFGPPSTILPPPPPPPPPTTILPPPPPPTTVPTIPGFGSFIEALFALLGFPLAGI
ncbi:MAG TPA: hypothetical protein VJ653_02490, partial [Acidimicrobiales bacterium]|nr:hypothetical protein [Acidimicrobiales bacterium]